ncbi:MAG: hypothetical protein R2698_02205 [Microthrixaceae bacterium]
MTGLTTRRRTTIGPKLAGCAMVMIAFVAACTPESSPSTTSTTPAPLNGPVLDGSTLPEGVALDIVAFGLFGPVSGPQGWSIAADGTVTARSSAPARRQGNGSALDPLGRWTLSGALDVVDATTGATVLDLASDVGSVSFSADGSRMMAVAPQGGSTRYEIYDTSSWATLRSTVIDDTFQRPVWSPSGREVVVDGGAGTATVVHVLSTDDPSGHSDRWVTIPVPALGDGDSTTYPVTVADWSPTGRLLLTRLAGPVSISTPAAPVDLFTASATDGSAVHLVRTGVASVFGDPGAVFSPGGERIAFVCDGAPSIASDSDGAAVTRLTNLGGVTSNLLLTANWR